MKRTKKTNKPSDAEKTKEPRWWIIYILAPIVVGVVLLVLSKACEDKHGELRIACNVDSAEVFLNHERKGFTQASTIRRIESLQPGVYILSVKKDGFAPVDTSVKIVVGEITAVKVALKSASVPGDSFKNVPKPPAVDSPTTKPASYQITITVPSKLKNAKIMIDGKWVANAPNTISLPKGQYRLRIENETYYYEEMLQVPSRNLVNVTEDEIIKRIRQ